MRDKTVLVVLLLAVYGWFFSIVYMLWVRPRRFIEWFLSRPYRAWGVQVTVVDENRLKRAARIFGSLTFVLLCLHAAFVFHAVLMKKW